METPQTICYANVRCPTLSDDVLGRFRKLASNEGMSSRDTNQAGDL
jgi:hypothetical protein